ncbi:MAG: enoyl-CoA hydratase-related protein [Desulfatirhabdiaceae bacterium]
MEFETVIYHKKDQVALITLNRPRVLNAMNKQLWLDIRNALHEAAMDDDVRAVVLTGQGLAFYRHRHFWMYLAVTASPAAACRCGVGSHPLKRARGMQKKTTKERR